ncbi:hypothetical protein ACH47X_05660 [Promicromonospora kroppenstedtii]|uniref:Uncharacterized protein n=1 Tax=Promicromonospora kroppenstedtii TaxID=440482 RepID=A0ABW7XFV4_9MICO
MIPSGPQAAPHDDRHHDEEAHIPLSVPAFVEAAFLTGISDGIA